MAPQRRTKKASKNGKNGKGKAREPEKPTLAQRNASVNKIISADQMNWKSVDIPDNLGDFGGFYGLEELEGVDVKMVNGKAEFIAKDEEKDSGIMEKLFGKKGKKEKGKKGKKETLEKEKTKEATEDKEEAKKETEPAVESGLDSEEFTGFELDEESEEPENLEDELSGSIFSSLDTPPIDESEIDLPQWEHMNLSKYTLMGLQHSGFSEPTPIQKETIPVAISGKDVVGKATTGSGKTLAYGIPLLEHHLRKLDEGETPDKNISGIIFAPTRELAHQVVDHLKSTARFSPLAKNGIVSITGGLSIQRQERLLLYSPGIVVATPGRFLELIERSQDLCVRMACTDAVVLDEADRLLQDGHFEEFDKILELLEKHRVKKDHGWRWQTLVFSATFSRDFFGKLSKNFKNNGQTGLIGNEEILGLLSKKLRFKDSKPFLCDANPKEIVSGQITEALVECGATERDLYVYYFVLNYPGLTLVFANSVDSVRRLVPLLENLGLPCFGIHSAMMQKQRLRALERFKLSCAKNKSSVLVATDVAARGLDIPNIDHIAHYHLPRSADIYVHRSGRTARAGKEGVSVMFCLPQEASGPLRKLRRMVAMGDSSKFAKTDVKLLPIDYDIVSQIRERVRMASLLADGAVASTATRKGDSWLKQAAEDLGVEDLDGLDAFEDDVIKKQRRRTEKNTLTPEESRQLRLQLKQRMSEPLRKNHRRSYLTSGLDNFAHQIVTGKTSKSILGKTDVPALEVLKKKNVQVKKEDSGKVARPGMVSRPGKVTKGKRK